MIRYCSEMIEIPEQQQTNNTNQLKTVAAYKRHTTIIILN